MTAFQIAFSAAYILLLICYLFSETSGNFKRRAVNKIAMAAMFLIYAAVAILLPPSGQMSFAVPSPEKIVVLAAFVFAFIGDVWLLWSFLKGGIAFIVSNLLFSAYLVLFILSEGIPVTKLLPFSVIYIALIGTVTALYKTKKIDFGKIGAAMIVYLASVSLHGCMSIGLLCFVHSARMILLCAGLVLFMISDYFIMTDKFIYHKHWVLRCNSATYFTGLLLACLSMSF